VAGSEVLELARKRWPDKMARLRDGFYTIRDEQGDRVPFRARPEQLDYLKTRHGLDVVLKARQLGFTTAIQLDMLDDCLFIPDTACGVIAHNLNDAKSFFRDKVKYPYDALPEQFKQAAAGQIAAEQDASDSLRFANGSSFRVGTSLRSGTLQRLHISEYGKLCAKYPEKAYEVRTGALNTVHIGQSITIESTAEGMSGHFHDMCMKAQALTESGAKLTAMDFKFHFKAWWQKESYRLDPEGVVITTEMQAYFDKIENEAGCALDPAQRAWYVKKDDQQGEGMKREFPSTPKEAFEASVEGAYFATQMSNVRKQGRICNIPILDAPVYTTWDLGYNDSMAIVFWQKLGMERRAIDYYENSGEGFGHYARALRERGYDYESHYFPHDGNQTQLTELATTKRDEAVKAGINPIDVLKRIKEERDGIEASRSFFPNVYFDEGRCSRLIACLDNYRKDWDDKLGVYKDRARHDEFSHGYKAFETAAIMPIPIKSKPIVYPKRAIV
jgi:hypothetical protein